MTKKSETFHLDDAYLVKHIILHLSFPFHILYAILGLLSFDLPWNENKR